MKTDPALLQSTFHQQLRQFLTDTTRVTRQLARRDRTQHIESLAEEMTQMAISGDSHGEWRALKRTLRYGGRAG
eukprot:1884392-Pyramimonas_sp.AAC.1